MFTFGYGPYDCIGKNFAQLELKVVLVKLLQNFQFSVKPEHSTYHRRILLGVEVDHPITINVKKL